MESGESGESGESRGRGGSARRGGGRDGGRDGRVRIAPGGLLFRFMTVGAVVDAVCDLYSGAGSGQSSTALSTSGDERWFNGGAVHSLALFNNGVTSLSGFRYLLHDLPPVFAAQLRWAHFFLFLFRSSCVSFLAISFSSSHCHRSLSLLIFIILLLLDASTSQRTMELSARTCSASSCSTRFRSSTILTDAPSRPPSAKLLAL